MARVFNGSASNYFAATGLKYNLPTNCSIVWRAKTSSDTTQVVMGARNTASSGGFFVARSDAFDSCYLSLVGDNEYFKTTAAWPADGSYHSFIITKSGTSLTLYVDSTTAVATATSGAYNSQTESDLYVGAWNAPGAANAFNGSLYDVAIFPSVLGSTDRSNFLGGTAPSGLTAAGTDHYWPLDNAAAGNESDSFGAATLTEVGVVGYESIAAAPVITGPSGAAGAATSTKSVAEGVTAVHTFTADMAVSWSKNGGADEADFTLNASTGELAFAAAPDFEAPGDSDANNTYVVVVRATATTGGATADQTVTVTATNQSEPPLAPTIGTATAGNASASVAFTPPTNTGRPAITGYTATSSPGGITGTGATSPITVSGLTNGTAYTFTVTAANPDGTGPASAASNSVTPSAGGSSPAPHRSFPLSILNH